MFLSFRGCSLQSLVGAGCIAVFASVTASGVAGQVAPQPRITAQVDNSQRVSLRGEVSPKARAADDVGAVATDMQLRGITLVFSRTAAQQAALDQLVADQQNPTSASYHHWLTPEQYAVRFGMGAADIATVQSWLEQQGFTVESVARSRTSISFSGTAAQVSAAFGAPLHNYRGQGGISSHFAPSTNLSIPSALAPVVQGVRNLASFRLHSRAQIKLPSLLPQYTVEGTQAYFLTPLDVATIYNLKTEYGQGYSGSGQTIAIVGQSAVSSADLANFRKALGLAANAPSLNLIPGTGGSQVFSGDEAESDLDLEYSGAVAPMATVAFYYVGNSPNYGVFDALQYVVDSDSAPIISISYGDCEFDIGASAIATLDSIFEQASSQGQSIIAASGDSGSQDCSPDTNLTATEQQAVAVDYPASSPYVTGVGGTEFPVADVTAPNTTYWTSEAGSSDLVSSAKAYIPEQVWNDDVAVKTWDGGGGGVSLYETRPAWQTGVTGIPSGTQRLVPDVSLAASPNYPGYLFCSSDTTATGVSNSCASGFRNSSGTSFSYDVAGGTSFAAPIFAGMVAVLNQANGNTTGQGLIAPTLYTLASNGATYASAFHDITSGGNECLLTAASCGTGIQTSDYLAGLGYDEASGLGSINFANLVTAWSYPRTSPSAVTATVLTATPASASSGSTVSLSAAVSSAGAPVTAGTVTFQSDSATIGTGTLNSNGVATISLSTLPIGADSITATYGGGASFAASVSNAVTVTVGAPSTVTTLSVSSLNLMSGSTVSLTASIVSNGVPVASGTVTFLSNGVSMGAASVSGGTASISLSSLSLGTDSIIASYGGTSNLAASASNVVTITVTAAVATTMTTLTAAPATVAAGAAVTLTAIVTSNGSAVTAGVVNFLDSGASIGTGLLNGSGTASISLNSLAAGAHSISAGYAGTASFTASTSASVAITVTTTPVAITVAAAPPVTPGVGTSSTVILSAGSSYSGTMNLSCALIASPVGAQNLPTCSLTPKTLTVKANAVGTATLAVQTTGATSTAQSSHAGPNPWGLGGGSALAVLMMFGLPSRRRRLFSALGLLLVLVAVGTVGCGGGAPSGTTSGAAATTAGTYTFTITGTDNSATPIITTSAVVSVTVQ